MSGTETKQGVTAGLRDGLTRAGREVWLAGLGAVTTVGEEAKTVFETLVEKGKSVEARTDKTLFDKTMNQVTDQLKGFSRKLEGGLQDTGKAVLHRFGVPSHAEVQALIAHVEQLSAKIDTIAHKEGGDGHEG